MAGFQQAAGPRVAGVPPSANGASSFHLGWVLPELPAAPLTEASVTLEVVEPPTVPRLYFWALQVDLADPAGRRTAGAHLGLQWHPQHPGSTAVNWGGYRTGGGELHGSESSLPSALHNVNTRDLAWLPGRAYRLTAQRVSEGRDGQQAWRGSVRDLVTGDHVVVRDLYTAGDHIVGVTMWSEVFARCDDPTTMVRWSDPSVSTSSGQVLAPTRLSVNYQSDAQGGCANTDSSVDGAGAVQRTGTTRVHRQGVQLPVSSDG
jgi:hypothetical protein